MFTVQNFEPQTEIGILLLVDEVVLDDVEDTNHLGEDEDLMSVSLELRQQFICKDEFPRRLDHRVKHLFRITLLSNAKFLQDLVLSACDNRTRKKDLYPIKTISYLSLHRLNGLVYLKNFVIEICN